MCELLSPVGNKERLMSAINAGCDAVYLSGINFGARSFAGNFDKEELICAINTCHLYGVKVYVTVNTLIYDSEVDVFMDYIDFLHLNNVDAVIMQDIGMIDLVRKTYPNLSIHASTQVNIHNIETVKLLENMGVKRVVLARETPIELIKEIKNNTNVEIEVFIHGALCISYSGGCLMSYMIGGRSGNKGTCAQCCRQKYSLKVDNIIVEKDKYLLSTKDLNTLEFISELINIGVDSLKIEGRMKSPEYVYLTTRTYRNAIDNKTPVTENDILNLKKIFNRDFTKGFIFHEDNDKYTNTYRPNHLGIKIGSVIDYKDGQAIIKLDKELNINDGIRIIGKKDVGTIVTKINHINNNIVSIKIDKVNIGDSVHKTSDYNYIKEIDDKIKINKKIKINGSCKIKVGKPIEFSISDGKNKVSITSDYVVEKAKTSITSKIDIKDQLSKLGNTVYEFNKLDIEMNENIFIPKIVLNNIRRNIVDLLNKKRLYKISYKKEKYFIDLKTYPKFNNKNILISTYEDYLKYKDKYDTIILDSKKLYDEINDKSVVLRTNRVCEYINSFNCKALVNDLGSVCKYKSVDTDFSLNVVNSYSVAYLHSIGVEKITLSYELNYKQIKNLVDKYHKRYNKHPNLEVIVDSYPEVMVSKYNLLSKYESKQGYLIDRFKNRYKIKIKNGFMYIYNYKKFKLDGDYFNIGINNIRINKEVG